MKNLLYRSIIVWFCIIIIAIYWKYMWLNDVQLFWFISYYLLICTLLISPLIYISYTQRICMNWSPFIISLRRTFGIWSWFFAILHTVIFWQWVQAMWEQFYSQEKTFGEFIFEECCIWWSESILWMSVFAFWSGVIGLTIMVLLLVISNNFFQKVLGARIWKNIQKIVYPLFLLIVFHIYVIWWWKGEYLYFALLLVVFRGYVFFHKNFSYIGSSQVQKNWYKKFLCPPCGFIYDEEFWDPDWWLQPWTLFDEISDERMCPVCWVMKKDFVLIGWEKSIGKNSEGAFSIKLVWKRELTHNVTEYVFYCPTAVESIPGQFYNIIFPKTQNWESFMRSYSVVKCIDNHITLCIRMKKWWLWSAVLKNIEEGTELKALWPFWTFQLQNSSKKKIFIATWTWIAPIIPMMRAAWDIDKELYFWVQRSSDLFYIDVLKNIPNLRVHVYLSQEMTKLYHYWRIEFSHISVNPESEVYMCWSPELIWDFVTAFAKKWIKKVHYEKFF
jgi:ferredoxin-NADP reductase/rubredoxin/DMSO/TMAO reductase YedYZ heme-binding membrane subunit